VDIIVSVLAVFVAFSCLAALLFSDIKDRRARAAANREPVAGSGPLERAQDHR